MNQIKNVVFSLVIFKMSIINVQKLTNLSSMMFPKVPVVIERVSETHALNM